ncbi:TonB-dependent receptor [bacterium AH-315-K03]|nr:TonB-dependent receptor [bacterium AH-315-K03]
MDNRKIIARTVLTTLILPLGISSTLGQNTPILEEVIVSGIRGSLQRAMDLKRDALGVVDAISAEDIGKFPDTNLAESLQRITGVSIDRSGGEGALITVRGFGPEFNTVLVNGRQMPSDNQGREFDFDNLASELISSVNVYKTSNASRQSGGIGSTVDIKTTRPFDINGFKLAGTIKGVHDTKADKTSPQLSALISNQFANNTLGVLFALSHQQRDSRRDEAVIDAWLPNPTFADGVLDNSANQTDNVYSPRNFQIKLHDEERTRSNASLVFQYAPTGNLTLTLDTLYSKYNVKDNISSYGIWFNPGAASNAITDANGVVTDFTEQNSMDFFSMRNEKQTQTHSFGLNLIWDVNESLTINVDASLADAEQNPGGELNTNQALVGFANQSRLIVTGADLPTLANIDLRDPNRAQNGGPQGNGNSYLDPSNMRSHIMVREGNQTKDSIDQFRLDGIWSLAREYGLTGVKLGLMHSTQTKDFVQVNNNAFWCEFCGFAAEPDLPDQWFQKQVNAGSDFLNGFSGNKHFPRTWLDYDPGQVFDFLEGVGDGHSFDPVRTENSYTIEEKTLSAYGEAEFSLSIASMPLTINAGTRWESTEVTADAEVRPLTELTIVDLTLLNATLGDTQSLSSDAKYTHFLPNLDLKLTISNNLIARFAASRTLTRPSIREMRPSLSIGVVRQGGDLSASVGNPELEPFTSDNIDLSLEWYYSETSYASIGYFEKEVDNFIVSSFIQTDINGVTDPSTGDDSHAPDANDQVGLFRVSIPTNGGSAKADGIELALQHTFDESGFGMQLNATFVDSAELNVYDITETFALTGLSDSANLVGFYEKGPLQLRLAYNWRDAFLQNFQQIQSPGEPIFVEAYSQWDLSANYDISDNLSVFIEGINITDEGYRRHARFDNQLIQAEKTGPRYAIGLRASF